MVESYESAQDVLKHPESTKISSGMKSLEAIWVASLAGEY